MAAPSEFDLIARYFDRPARGAVLGIGDDAALLDPAPGMELAVSTDLLLEGRHFRAGADARRLGHKALAVNLSDLAAMGATPRWATLALALPAADEAWLAAFAAGFFALADRFGVALVGGDTTRAREGAGLAICVTIFGEVPPGTALLRSGARAGDDVWVSGTLGGAALALQDDSNAAARERLDMPEPRVALGERLRGLASAAIDVSDGFAQDLGHILERSGVGAVVEFARLPAFPGASPRHVLAGGDDYELVFSAPSARRASIEDAARAIALPVARVGEIRSGAAPAVVLDAGRQPMPLPHGFDHFGA